MNVPVFIDIPVPHQTLELRTFLKSLGAEIAEENAESGLCTDLKNIIEASKLCWNMNNDADVEMVFNGIISLLLLVPAAEAESVVTLFCEKVGKVPDGDKRAALRLRMLSTLFYGLESGTSLRYVVLCSLMRLAGQHDLLSMVPVDLDQMKLWIAQWGISPAKTQVLYRTLHDSLIACNMRDVATKVMIELLGTYTEDNASQAREDAHKCIVTCLADPNTFLMDHLLSLKPVKFLEGELIHDLLTIFVSGKLNQYQQFYKNNKDFITSLGASHEENLRKMRLLTFMQMCENRKEMDFSLIQEEMQLEKDQVEEFVIDVLKTKAVRARIDQIQEKVIISSTTFRTFNKHHWQVIRQHLSDWLENLNSLDVNFQSVSLIQSQVQQQ
ncbi:eukaryotic translation initiation factor 3 subunit M [Elysia marginata]|uniref:Eukaryotic translation initiation factor 3 subunit M n=1 Tax=Elysia marginata TaxID=1093978 RepID=A0AAV4GLN3_9GAST|nr:eukaryotic translation initiation factor 3 subunit M [Elysia marginata]